MKKANRAPGLIVTVAAAIFALTFALTMGQASAVPLVIDNSSFESDILVGGAWMPSVTDWGTSGAVGTWNPTISQYPGGAPDGSNVAYLNTGYISQTLSDVLTAGHEYTLSVYVGQRLDLSSPGYAVQLWAGGTLLGEESSLILTAGTFSTSTLTYLAAAGDPLLGQALEIRLLTSGIQTNFDAVRLNNCTFEVGNCDTVVAVPEPGTLLLLGSGLIGLAFLRKKLMA